MPLFVIVGALFGVTGVMICDFRMAASFGRALRISSGVGVVARRVGVVTTPCLAIGMVVSGISMACLVSGNRDVVVGMVAVIFCMLMFSGG